MLTPPILSITAERLGRVRVSPINVWTQPTVGSPNWTAQGPPMPIVWYVQQLAGNLTNYVAAVCSHGN